MVETLGGPFQLSRFIYPIRISRLGYILFHRSVHMINTLRVFLESGRPSDATIGASCKDSAGMVNTLQVTLLGSGRPNNETIVAPCNGGAGMTNMLQGYPGFERRNDARIVTSCESGASMTNTLRASPAQGDKGCFVQWPSRDRRDKHLNL